MLTFPFYHLLFGTHSFVQSFFHFTICCSLSSILSSVFSAPHPSPHLPSHFREVIWPKLPKSVIGRNKSPDLPSSASSLLHPSQSPAMHTANNLIHYHLVISAKDKDMILARNLREKAKINWIQSKHGGGGGIRDESTVNVNVSKRVSKRTVTPSCSPLHSQHLSSAWHVGGA